MVQGVNNCNCNCSSTYIDKWFLYFGTEDSFKAHLEKNFINPESICFIEQTGQLYTNGKFFGICKEDFNQLKSVVFNHTRMIQNILGLEGPSVGDGIINTLKDIQDFLNGFTTEDNLNDYINQIKFALQGSIEDVQLQLNTKATELTKKVDDALLELNRVEIALKARCDLHDSEISLIKQRLVSAENDLTRITSEWNEFNASYMNWQKYVEGRLDTLNDSFLALQASDNKLHNEIEELNAKVNRYDARIENCVSMVQNCFAAITEAEQKFNDLRTEVSDFYNTKGHPNGLCPLNESGTVDAQFLPSYVDDVLEYPSIDQFPPEGEFNKIYVTLDTNLTYRWSGSRYIEISKSLAIGETSDTAFAGNRGKALEENLERHKADNQNPHHVTKAQIGLSEVDNTADMYKPVSGPQQDAMNQLEANIKKDIAAQVVEADENLKKELNGKITDTTQKLDRHIADKSNPHNVTKSQLGLDMVDNTADLDKPVSVPQKIAIDDAKKAGTEAQAALTEHKNDTNNPHSVTAAQVGLDRVNNTADSEKPVSQAQRIAINAVQTALDNHKADKANPHEVTKAQIGLDRVDNTSDKEKPISDATLNALKTQRDEIMEEIKTMKDNSEEVASLKAEVEELKGQLEWAEA